MVYQCTLDPTRTAVFHPSVHCPDPHHSLLLLVLGRQRLAWRARHLFVQVGLFCLWLVRSIFHLVRRLPMVCRPGLSSPRIELLAHVPAQRGSFAIPSFKTGFLAGGAYISFIWLLYPICWGLSEGGNKITPTSEMVFYGILDIMSAPVFLLGFIVYLTQFDDQQLSATAFGTTDRGEDVEQQAAPLPQKPPQPQGAPPAGTNQAAT